MLLLNIFQHSDGTFAWDIVLFLLLALIAGYLLNRYATKKVADNKHAAGIAASEAKYKKLENEYKNYKSNITSAEKQNEKSVVQLSSRVKALEGDIRVLSEEKNKSNQQLLLKEEDIKRYSRQLADLEDGLKTLRENKLKEDEEWNNKLKTAKEELIKATAWETRVKAAEEEAQRAKSAIGNAERKKLEAELRLKATTEYAGKVGPMENELNFLKQQFVVLESELKTKTNLIAELQSKANSSEEVFSALKAASAQLELQKENNKTLQHEFEIKHAANVSLINEIQYLKTTMTKMAAENEMLKSKMPLGITSVGDAVKSGEAEKAI
jgi:chromosome segregation ATPase